MDDKSFEELKLAVAICPEQAAWNPPRFDHEVAVCDAANECRAAVGKLYAEVDHINQDQNLTIKGKQVACARAAKAALDALGKSDSLQRAKDKVAYQISRWDTKFGLDQVLATPDDPYTISLHAEIRSRVAAMTREGRLAFLQQYGSSPMVAAALIGGAPNFLSNISDSEAGMIRSRLERERVPTEISEARTATLKALAACEKGWVRAQQLISGRRLGREHFFALAPNVGATHISGKKGGAWKLLAKGNFVSHDEPTTRTTCA